MDSARFYRKEYEYFTANELFFRIAAVTFIFVIGAFFVEFILRFLESLMTGPMAVAMTTIAFGTAFCPVGWYAAREYTSANLKFRRFFIGSRGDDLVGDLLMKLPAAYSVFENIRISSDGGTGFVVIGPTGVFAICSKNVAGTIEFDGRELRRNGRRFQNDVLEASVNGARDISEYLSAVLNQTVSVTPMLVFPEERALMHFGLKQLNHVYVIQGQSLLKFIQLQPNANYSQADIVEALRVLLGR